MAFTDCHQWEAIHSREASLSENLFPENVYFADEYGVEIATSQHQTLPVYAVPPVPADFTSNQYVVNPMPEQSTYAVVPPYLRYAAPTLSLQKLTHQIESLNTAGHPEVVPASPQSYLVSPLPAHSIYPQQFLVSSQVSTVYSPQPYFLPVLQSDCVPNVAAVQGTYPVSITHYPISSYECNDIQQANLMDAIRIAKSGPMFESSTTVTENENVSK